MSEKLAFPNVNRYDDLNRVGVYGYKVQDALTAYDKAAAGGHHKRDDTQYESQLHAVQDARDLVTSSLGINEMEFGDYKYYYKAYYALQLKSAVIVKFESEAKAPYDRFFTEFLGPADARGARVLTTLYPNPVSSREACIDNHTIAEEIVTKVNGELGG